MSLAISRSRGGSPVCSADGAYLHSPYSPEREAERFIESRISGSSPTTILLLGPCLDYLSPILRLRFPGSSIVAVQYSPFFRGRESGRADASWYPDAALPLDFFLEASIGEDAASGIAVLEWAPAARAFPEASASAKAAVRASLDRLASSAATVKANGPLWMLNACRSFLLAESLARPSRTDSPIALAIPGPSLEEALSLLAPLAGSFRLVAVSSALASCLAAGLEPDLVVATDGGYWSRAHLYPFAAGTGEGQAPLAAPLTALPSASLWSRIRLLPLDQGSFAESELLPFLGGGERLPPHGTVAGSALRLAAALGEGPLVVAGMDLASRGEAEHARPHGFEHALAGAASRLEPREGLRWERRACGSPLALGDGWFGSRSLAIYAQALTQDALALRGRLFRLFPSPQDLPGFAPIGAIELGTILGGRARNTGRLEFPSRAELPGFAPRREFLAARLEAWGRMAAGAAAELAAGGAPRDPRMNELFRSLDLPDWAAARRAIARAADPAPAARSLAARVGDRLGEIERRLLS